VQRRFKELYRKNPYITIEEVTNNLAMRDYIDSNREISPLKKADDAVMMDNTDLTKDEFFAIAVEKAGAIINA
jgi:cytidylate kinase